MKNYKINLYQIETENGRDWVAEYPAIKGLLGTDSTAEGAIKELAEGLDFHLDSMRIAGVPIPDEDALVEETNYSGRLTLRTSKSAHAKIAEAANREGVSVNQWMNEVINNALGVVEGYESGLKSISNLINKLQSNVSVLSNYFSSEKVHKYFDETSKDNGYVRSGRVKIASITKLGGLKKQHEEY